MATTRWNVRGRVFTAFAVGTAILCAATIAQAQGKGEVMLRDAQVTEAALIEALNVDAGAPRTRGFRPPSQAGENAPPANKGKANLLMTFATDSAELTNDTRKVLDVVARALQSDSLVAKSFQIEGHADPRGDAEHNRALSQARAEAVAGYLTSKHNIQTERLVPVGKGDREPLNTARVDAPENRRVTIVTGRN